jgi:uncharacterized cupin superfamily protein
MSGAVRIGVFQMTFLANLRLQEDAGALAEAGQYYEMKTFPATATSRTIYTKGVEVVIFRKGAQHRYRPENGEVLTVPAGYTVRVAKGWVAWA